MGYVADRFSRRALNITGNIGIAITFCMYSIAQSFWMAVVCEILCGLFIAMSGGVDRAFLKIYSDKIDSSGSLFKKKTAQLAVLQIAGMCAAILIGMAITRQGGTALADGGILNGAAGAALADGGILNGAAGTALAEGGILDRAAGAALAEGGMAGGTAVAATPLSNSIRSSILAVAVPFLTAAVLASMIKDIGERIVARHANHFKDMAENFRHVIKSAEVKWMIYAYAIGYEVTHPIVWALTPLLTANGFPVWLVGIGWILWYGLAPVGTWFAKKTSHWKTSSQAVVPFTAVLLASLPAIIATSRATVLFFSLTGVSFGIVNVYIMPKLQARTDEKYQTTVVSIASTAARLIYIPAVVITNYFGNTAPQHILLAAVLIFAPLTLLAWAKLRRIERGPTIIN
jgi:hypothetical protein